MQFLLARFFQNQKSVLARWFALLSGRFLSILKIKRDLDYLPVATLCCFRMFFSFVAPFILVFMVLSLRRKRIILSSSSSIISLSMSSKVCLSIVSKADDMSIPVILISTSSFLVLAASHLCAHATSAVLLSGLKPLWL